MQKRELYSLVFGIPGFFIAGIVSLLLFGAVVGGLWIFVFGDNPWPASTEKIISVLFVLTFLIVWITSIAIGYSLGKRLERNSTLNKNHVLISAALTALFILFIVFQQWSVGNIGPKSDSMLCSDYCSAQGYSASEMPPLNSGDRTCNCYDSSGHEALKVPLDTIKPGPSK
jgi:hypothetical protein